MPMRIDDKKIAVEEVATLEDKQLNRIKDTSGNS